MQLSIVKNMITSKVARQLLLTRKHSPVILFGAGVAGVIATTVLASRATLKLDDILAEAQEDLEKVRSIENAKYTEELRSRDIAIIYGRTTTKVLKIYAPAIGVGILSIGALTGSHIMLSRRNAAVMAAYATLDRGFREYRQRVRDEFGDEKDRDILYCLEDATIAEDTDEGTITKTIKQAGIKSIGGGYGVFFDEKSNNWSKQWMYNQTFLSNIQNWANDMLRARGHVFLNDVFDMLGLPRTSAGAVVGWVNGQGEYISFGVFENDVERAKRFIEGVERSILLNFNVHGIIWDKI